MRPREVSKQKTFALNRFPDGRKFYEGSYIEQSERSKFENKFNNLACLENQGSRAELVLSNGQSERM